MSNEHKDWINDIKQSVEKAMTEYLGYEKVQEQGGGNWYVKGTFRIPEDEVVDMYRSFTAGEYDYGYDRALQHIMGICQKELEDRA